jgi:hypothetical protein
MADEIAIRFENVSVGEANILAEELRGELLDADRSLTVERRRDNPSTQDAGATLLLILGTQSVVILAQAVRAWAARRPGTSLRVETKDGTLVATGLDHKNSAKIVQAFVDAIATGNKSRR